MKSKITYSKTEFEKISIDAFKFKPIQDILKIWETTNQVEINKEADEIIENIKFWNQKIMGWNNYKFINRISDKSIKRVKLIDLNERENDDTLKFQIKDDHIINNDEKYELLEKENIINTNALRVLPSTTDLSVLTSVFDHSKGKWLESSRASHPFISVRITKIDPTNNNKNSSPTTTQCLMADSGAQCSLLNFATVRSMGIDPENLATSNACSNCEHKQ